MEEHSGFVWSNINSTKLTDEKGDEADITYAMYKLGFDVYDSNIEESQWKDKNDDGINDFYINRIDENFELEPGDSTYPDCESESDSPPSLVVGSSDGGSS